MHISDAILDEIERDIQGICQDLFQVMERVLEEHGIDLSDLPFSEELRIIGYVEDRHFLCQQCGWWCESGDWNEAAATCDGDVCTDCAPLEEDE